MGDPVSNHGAFTLGKIFVSATQPTTHLLLTTGGGVFRAVAVCLLPPSVCIGKDKRKAGRLVERGGLTI
jgi:hypothetical protein